ncbi:Hsp20/alpha crystallin family protein [Candidatus Gracilibacteria bacterium]|nr:Hsp20/alpha crystallin family protein [Candidatus Gracilibacteria bacterium]
MVKWFGIGEDNSSEAEEVVEYHELETPNEEIGQIAVDIVDSNESITIVAPVAGIELEDIDVALDNAVLTISGTRKQPADLYDFRDAVVKNSECFWGKFTRNIILPENLDFDSVRATMEAGLLMVKISKLSFASKNIQVESLDD